MAKKKKKLSPSGTTIGLRMKNGNRESVDIPARRRKFKVNGNPIPFILSQDGLTKSEADDNIAYNKELSPCYMRKVKTKHGWATFWCGKDSNGDIDIAKRNKHADEWYDWYKKEQRKKKKGKK